MSDDPSDTDQRGKPHPVAPDAPLPAPLNDNEIATDADHFAQLWGLVAHRRLDAIERRVAKLEKQRQLQLVGGADFEADFAQVKHELAVMDVPVATFFRPSGPRPAGRFLGDAMSDIEIEKREETMMIDKRVFCSVCVFSGDLPETDSDAAAKALHAAGFEVYRLPPELKAKLEVAGDDFIEIRRDDRSRAAMEAEANRIVEPLGGSVELGFESIVEFFMPPPRRNGNVVSLVGRLMSKKTMQ
jgi:hypothetical protein